MILHISTYQTHESLGAKIKKRGEIAVNFNILSNSFRLVLIFVSLSLNPAICELILKLGGPKSKPQTFDHILIRQILIHFHFYGHIL